MFRRVKQWTIEFSLTLRFVTGKPALKVVGQDVHDTRGTTDVRMPDNELWQKARLERRLSIATDKGFTRHRSVPHHGIPIILLRQANLRKIHQFILQAFRRFSDTKLPGLLAMRKDAVQSAWQIGG
jgi:predicted nuclease of predicted toxin-antitoxin system